MLAGAMVDAFMHRIEMDFDVALSPSTAIWKLHTLWCVGPQSEPGPMPRVTWAISGARPSWILPWSSGSRRYSRR